MAGWLGATIGVVMVFGGALLFRGPRPSSAAPNLPARALRLETGDEVDVRGESHYQAALEKICGGRTREGAEHRCWALLIPEPSNAYDPNAVRVEIQDQLVGYLSRPAAVAYRPIAEALASRGRVGAAEAEIVGGWERGSDRGHFGIRLYLAQPEILLQGLTRP